ncbi:MAG: hypothetical protein ACLR7Z_21600 [Bilophila wadsworthia]
MKEFAESANKPVTRENSTPYVLACMEKAKKKHPWMQLNPLASVQEAPQPSGEKWDISRATRSLCRIQFGLGSEKDHQQA